MKDLPTITVTDAQASRILAVFGSTDAYKSWLRDQIKSAVIQEEVRKAHQNVNSDFAVDVDPPVSPTA